MSLEGLASPGYGHEHVLECVCGVFLHTTRDVHEHRRTCLDPIRPELERHDARERQRRIEEALA